MEKANADRWTAIRRFLRIPEPVAHYTSIPDCPQYRPTMEVAHEFGEVFFGTPVKPQRVIDLMNEAEFMKYTVLSNIYLDRLLALVRQNVQPSLDDTTLAQGVLDAGLRKEELMKRGWKPEEITAATSVARGTVAKPILPL